MSDRVCIGDFAGVKNIVIYVISSLLCYIIIFIFMFVIIILMPGKTGIHLNLV